MDLNQPPLIASDLEGVLVPEIWVEVAESTGIEQLRLTTREISDYDALMKMRIGILRQHNLRLTDIQAVIGTLSPLPGAAEFVAWVRERAQFIILSDTFYEFAAPLMKQLMLPTIFCHSLLIDEDGFISGYRMRLEKPKRRSIRALRKLGFRTMAMGDSYNDIAMLEKAHVGLLFAPPDNVVADHPNFPVVTTYEDARTFIDEKFLGL
ncbi:MAG: bifunctional phosphoserine phosphatase/homoserine phosphotransferase ThrH [Caldilineaceae bacterium]|nr:bifunctional phosphoserine phosphatase/homoserine phosphotransferase ThrH [Caldilineaceae bacterium]